MAQRPPPGSGQGSNRIGDTNAQNSTVVQGNFLGPVTVSSGPDQGSVVWADLANKSVSFTVGELAHLNKAGISPYTVVVLHALFQKFQIGSQGSWELEEALASLQAHSSWGQVLSFGFGPQSFIRFLARSAEGRCALALTSALVDTYDEEFAAEVLNEMLLVLKAPSNLTPSLGEWLSFARACAGSTSTTAIPRIVEQFMRLYQNTKKSHFPAFENRPYRRNVKASSLARALMSLGDLTKNILDSFTIRGGVNCGWIAAIAFRLFNLNIQLEWEGPDNVLFRNFTKQSGGAHLRITFQSEPEQTDLPLAVTSKTYILQEFKDLVREYGQWGNTYPGGRLEWDDCLSIAFGEPLRRLLLEKHQAVAVGFGSAAKVLETFNSRNPDIFKKAESVPRLGLNFSLLSHSFVHPIFRDAGTFLSSVVQNFPELSSLEPEMSSATQINFAEAIKHFKTSMRNLRDSCTCSECRPERTLGTATRWCLANLLMVLLRLSKLMVVANVPKTLLPLHQGLRWIYFDHERHVPKRYKSWIVDENDDEKDSITYLHGFLRALGEKGPASDRTWRPFVDLLAIFAGSSSTQISGGLITAASAGGICVYSEVLQNISLDARCISSLVIIPGRLEYNSKPYNTVEDMSKETDESDTESDLEECRNDLLGATDLALAVTETPTVLRVQFVLQKEVNGEMYPIIQVKPFTYTITVCMARLAVCCPCEPDQKSCKRFEPDRIGSSDNGDSMYYSRNRVMVACKESSLPQWLDYVGLLRGGDWGCILRGEACLDCCLYAAVDPSNITWNRCFILDA